MCVDSHEKVDTLKHEEHGVPKIVQQTTGTNDDSELHASTPLPPLSVGHPIYHPRSCDP